MFKRIKEWFYDKSVYIDRLEPLMEFLPYKVIPEAFTDKKQILHNQKIVNGEKNMKAETEILIELNNCLHMLANQLKSGHPIIASAIENSVNHWNERISVIQEKYNTEMLEGNGPLSKLKTKLGIKNKRINLIESNRNNVSLSDENVKDLMKEFLSVEMTNYSEGGYGVFVPLKHSHGKLTWPTNEDYGKAFSKKTGFYVINHILTVFAVRVIQNTEQCSYVVIEFPNNSLPTIKILTWVASEDEWVFHNTWDILPVDKFRTNFIMTLKLNGVDTFFPPIEEIEMEKVLIEYMCGIEIENLAITKSPYVLTAIKSETNKVDFRIVKESHCGFTGKKLTDDVKWDRLSTIKQNQFLAKVSAVK